MQDSFVTSHVQLGPNSKAVQVWGQPRCRTGASGVALLPVLSAEHSFREHPLQLYGISSKFADAVGELLHGHLVFVVQPTEGLLVQMYLLRVTGLGWGIPQLSMPASPVDSPLSLRPKLSVSPQG